VHPPEANAPAADIGHANGIEKETAHGITVLRKEEIGKLDALKFGERTEDEKVESKK
jgi:hypothetical protein